MIRRTRNEISKYYSEDLQKNHVTFPALGTPEAVSNTPDTCRGDVYKSDEFDAQFIIDLESDLSNLKNLRKIWEDVTRDPKLNRLREELQGNEKFQGNKKIIFTESKETAATKKHLSLEERIPEISAR